MRPSLVAAVLALVLPGVAAAQPVEVYVARLSSHDHHNSNGQRLTTIAAIIRQDRANFHRFGIRDPEDDDDAFFDDANNRARLERLIARGSVSRRAGRAILYGTPLIQVTVYDNYVDIDVAR